MIGVIVVDVLVMWAWTRRSWLVTAYVRLSCRCIIRTRGIGALLRLIYHSRFHNSHFCTCTLFNFANHGD